MYFFTAAFNLKFYFIAEADFNLENTSDKIHFLNKMLTQWYITELHYSVIYFKLVNNPI